MRKIEIVCVLFFLIAGKAVFSQDCKDVFEKNEYDKVTESKNLETKIVSKQFTARIRFFFVSREGKIYLCFNGVQTNGLQRLILVFGNAKLDTTFSQPINADKKEVVANFPVHRYSVLLNDATIEKIKAQPLKIVRLYFSDSGSSYTEYELNEATQKRAKDFFNCLLVESGKK